MAEAFPTGYCTHLVVSVLLLPVLSGISSQLVSLYLHLSDVLDDKGLMFFLQVMKYKSHILGFYS